MWCLNLLITMILVGDYSSFLHTIKRESDRKEESSVLPCAAAACYHDQQKGIRKCCC